MMLAQVLSLEEGKNHPPTRYTSQPTTEPEWNAGSPDAGNLAIVSEEIQVIRPHYKVSLELKTEMEIYWELWVAPDNWAPC